MKQIILTSLTMLPLVSFADIAVGPDFSNGFLIKDYIMAYMQNPLIFFGVVILIIIVGVIIIRKYANRKNNDNLPK